MKIRKHYLFLLLLSAYVGTYAQVGVNTVNPQGVFHVDGAKDNPATGTPTATQQANDVLVDASGNVGVGTITPSNKVHINAANPLRLQGLTAGNSSTDPLVVADANGVLKTIGTLSVLSVPTPAIFRLETTQTNFLNGMAAGAQQAVPMSLVKNSIPGLTYSGNTISFPAGTYQMTFVYEASHNNTGCTISSYFIDFPLNTGSTRIHNTASHNEGVLSNHGGTITYATALPARTWNIQLGRGQSGNCTGTGMNLAANSTQLLIFRIGD
ncbi:hypothetical protein AAEU33_08200 [Chryseobacterium sp. Chry.R1]|uniref:hypothetical protein n=1 Tax=Chryseobacterium sp. Chry.R1 TaxID=3139392 RepID=UPI0031F76492